MNIFSEYKGLRRENYVLFFGRIVTSMGSMVWAMMTMILNLKMGYTATETALALVVGGIIILPAVLIGGKLADKYNKKWIIVICDGISVAFYIICGFIPLSVTTIAMIIIAAMFQSMEGPAYSALIADLNPTSHRERAYSLLYLGGNIGYVLSPTIAGYLFKDLLWLAFVISGISIAISTLLIIIFLKDITPYEDTSEAAVYQKSREGVSIFRILRENPPVVIFMLSLVFYEAAYDQFGYLIPLDLGRLYGEDGAVTIGTMTSLNCILVVLFTPLITKYLAKLKEIPKCTLGFIAQTLGYVVFVSFITRMPAYYGATVFLTIGEVLWAIARAPYFTARVPASHRGRVDGVSQTMMMFAMGLSEYITGNIYDRAGSGGAWIYTFIMSAAGILMMLGAFAMDKKKYPVLYSSGQAEAALADGAVIESSLAEMTAAEAAVRCPAEAAVEAAAAEEIVSGAASGPENREM
ncbi:MAG: MFS transporter [Lachnospiraceae bacterium]|nr:MFS transporter [Lachnospiraceae bacterium]